MKAVAAAALIQVWIALLDVSARKGGIDSAGNGGVRVTINSNGDRINADAGCKGPGLVHIHTAAVQEVHGGQD